MLKKLTLAGIFMLGASTLAHAADIDPAPAFSDWTGFYIGAGGGYQWGDFAVDAEACQPGGTTCNEDRPYNGDIYSLDLEDSGWFATGQLGFDYQFHDSFVVGAMIDVSAGQELEDSEFNTFNPLGLDPPVRPNDGQSWDASLDGMLTLSGRAGFLVTPDALIYGLAGWSWAEAEVSAFEGCDFGGSIDCNNTNIESSETLNGLTLGAGLEWAFIENFSARVEYRYTDLGSIEAEGVNDLDPPSTLSTETDVTVQSVRMTLNYRF
jgi:outer membrane immunogenic protein